MRQSLLLVSLAKTLDANKALFITITSDNNRLSITEEVMDAHTGEPLNQLKLRVNTEKEIPAKLRETISPLPRGKKVE